MENAYHFTNEWAGMPVKLGKLARYFGKLEFVKFFTYTKYQFIPTMEFIDQNENLVFHLS